jgi:hypothetical protein
MKNERSISISFFGLICSVVFLFASQAARAETPSGETKDLASSLHLKTGGLSVEKQRAADGINEVEKAQRLVVLPLKEGLAAFFDFDSPLGSDPAASRKKASVRPLLGFHIPLR